MIGNPPTRYPGLEQALAAREVLHLQEDGVEVRVYDTDQILIRGTKSVEGESRMEGSKRVTDIQQAPVRATYDLRRGQGDLFVERVGNVGGYGGGFSFNYPITHTYPDGVECIDTAKRLLQAHGVDVNKWSIPDDHKNSSPKRYPELEAFVNGLHAAFSAQYAKRHERAIWGFLPTLFGHGNMHPLTLLNPRVMWGYVWGTVWPFGKVNGFDMQQGRKTLQETGECVASQDVKAYDGMIALIRPFRYGDTEDKHQTAMDVYCFNPTQYKKFQQGELRVEEALPSKENTIFRITYGIEDGRKWIHFTTDQFDSDTLKREDLLNPWKHDVYVRIDEGLTTKLEQMAPLPLHALR